MERIQYHQKEIDQAKQVLLNVQKPQPNMNYMNHYPSSSPFGQNVQIESQMSKNYNKYIPPFQQTQYNSQPSDFNQSNQFHVQPPQPNHYNVQPPQQNYYLSKQYDLQKQFSGISPPNSFYSTYQNYSPLDNFQSQIMNDYPKVNLQRSKQVQTEVKQDYPQLPSGVFQFLPEQQPSQQLSFAPTRPLSETELEYIQFLRFKEYNIKQQQQIDDQEFQDFQDFQEFRKQKQEQLLRQRVDQQEEKLILTDFYKRKNRQVYSEQEYKSQLDKKRDNQQNQINPLQQETNIEIDQTKHALMRLQTDANKDFFK